METALHFYNLAKDYLSLVRVYCYCDNLDKVNKVLLLFADLLFWNIELAGYSVTGYPVKVLPDTGYRAK